MPFVFILFMYLFGSSFVFCFLFLCCFFVIYFSFVKWCIERHTSCYNLQLLCCLSCHDYEIAVARATIATALEMHELYYFLWQFSLLGHTWSHNNDVTMSAMASQIAGVSIVCSSVCSGVDQRKHQSSASVDFVRGIHRWPLNSPHTRPVTRKMLPFDDVIMSCEENSPYSWWGAMNMLIRDEIVVEINGNATQRRHDANITSLLCQKDVVLT